MEIRALLFSLYYVILSIAAILVYLIPSLHDSSLLLHGKLNKEPNPCNGLRKYLTLSKSHFRDFYVFGLIYALFTFFNDKHPSFLLLLFCFHLTRRIIENTFYMKYSPQSKMHLGHYFLGMTYYWVTISSLSEASMNGVFSMGLFLSANYWQFQSHKMLGSLRQAQQCADDGPLHVPYPKKGLFTWVLFPHYAMEILIYLSLLWMNVKESAHYPLLFNLLWVCVNMSITSIKSREWYLSLFPADTERASLLPFIV